MEWADYKGKVKEALEKSKFDVAETTLLQALQWVKDTGGSNERLCLCLDQLAWIYVNIKDLDRAAACYKESLEIKGTILGEQNPIVARACKKLATVVYMQKRYDLAEKYSKDALNIFKQTLGVDHEETQQTLSDLVSLLRKMGRNIEANILQNMGKTSIAATEALPIEQIQKGYSTSQTFLRIKVCANCGLPFDGEFCMRCTEGRLLAHQASDLHAQSNVKTGEQNIRPMEQNLLDQQLHQDNLFPPKGQTPLENQQQQPNPELQQNEQLQNQQQQNQQQHNQHPREANQQPQFQQQEPNPQPQFQQPEQNQQQPNEQPQENQTQYQQPLENQQQPYQEPDGQQSQPQRPSQQIKPQNVLALLQQQQQNQQQQQVQQPSNQPGEQQQNQLQTFPNLQQQHQRDLLQTLELHQQNQLQLDQQNQQGQPQEQQPKQRPQQNQVSEQQLKDQRQNYQNLPIQEVTPPPPSEPWPEHQPAAFPGQPSAPQNQPPPNMPLPAAPPAFPGVPPSLVPSQLPQPAPPNFSQLQDPSFSGGFQQVQTGQSLGTTGGFQIPNASSFAGMGASNHLPDALNLETTGGFQHAPNPDSLGNNRPDEIESSGIQIDLERFPMPDSLSATGGFMQVSKQDNTNDVNQQQHNERQNLDPPPPSNDQQQQ